nr:MAG TPA: hypothetical protein [Caudoviricetes sp.]
MVQHVGSWISQPYYLISICKGTNKSAYMQIY